MLVEPVCKRTPIKSLQGPPPWAPSGQAFPTDSLSNGCTRDKQIKSLIMRTGKSQTMSMLTIRNMIWIESHMSSVVQDS